MDEDEKRMMDRFSAMDDDQNIRAIEMKKRQEKKKQEWESKFEKNRG
jgi:hypothetical protein